MEQWLSLLQLYNIVAFFVFDGKSPSNKQQELKERQKSKTQSKQTYYELVESLATCDDPAKQEIIQAKINALKPKLVYMTQAKIDGVKQLILAHGQHTVIEACGEADEVCAKLCLEPTNNVYACMSDDMDMFLYGCPRILRSLDLSAETIELFDLPGILHYLQMTQKELIDICVLSNTDYHKNNNNLLQTLSHFKRYKQWKKRLYKHKHKNKEDTTTDTINDSTNFHAWLVKYTNYIRKDEFDMYGGLSQQFLAFYKER
jgi:hypothetical protein